ncbi:MAG: ornithine carbamoyltransferase, partial [Candidatus Micrarchaeia archaeon]
MANLKGRNMISLNDYSSEDITQILDRAIEIKKNPEKYSDILKNKTLIMLFEKSSTRTRLSFEAGMTQLGGHAIFLDRKTTQFTIADFADEMRATVRFGDILMYRPLKNKSLVETVKVSRIPVINALCEKYHPCQALGDALTMIEKSGGKVSDLKGKKVVWLGLGDNVSNTLVTACTKLGAK